MPTLTIKQIRNRLNAVQQVDYHQIEQKHIDGLWNTLALHMRELINEEGAIPSIKKNLTIDMYSELSELVSIYDEFTIPSIDQLIYPSEPVASGNWIANAAQAAGNTLWGLLSGQTTETPAPEATDEAEEDLSEFVDAESFFAEDDDDLSSDYESSVYDGEDDVEEVRASFSTNAADTAEEESPASENITQAVGNLFWRLTGAQAIEDQLGEAYEVAPDPDAPTLGNLFTNAVQASVTTAGDALFELVKDPEEMSQDAEAPGEIVTPTQPVPEEEAPASGSLMQDLSDATWWLVGGKAVIDQLGETYGVVPDTDASTPGARLYNRMQAAANAAGDALYRLAGLEDEVPADEVEVAPETPADEVEVVAPEAVLTPEEMIQDILELHQAIELSKENLTPPQATPEIQIEIIKPDVTVVLNNACASLKRFTMAKFDEDALDDILASALNLAEIAQNAPEALTEAELQIHIAHCNSLHYKLFQLGIEGKAGKYDLTQAEMEALAEEGQDPIEADSAGRKLWINVVNAVKLLLNCVTWVFTASKHSHRNLAAEKTQNRSHFFAVPQTKQEQIMIQDDVLKLQNQLHEITKQLEHVSEEQLEAEADETASTASTLELG